MKNFMKGLVIFNCFGLLGLAHAADIGLNASSLKLKVYKMAVSTSPLCTNLITVLDNGSTPTEMDFLQNPSLGSGTLSNGTYPCIVIEMSDLIKFTPSANSDSGHCVMATEYTLDVCRSDNGDTSRLISGATTTCTGTSSPRVAGDDRVALYISTATSGNSGDAFNAPTSVGDTARGINLGAALTITGTSSGKMIVNTTGQVCDNAAACDGGPGGTSCTMEAPAFSFQKITN